MSDQLRYKGLREKLVEDLRKKGITDERVLSAIGEVPRHLFMESGLIQFAYKDQAFPIAAGQTISQPYTVAFQSQLLEVQPRHRVLEIGTGSGYQAAVLVAMGASLFSVERQRVLFLKAKSILEKLNYHPGLFFGDGYAGLPTYAPFDRILVTCGAESVPEALLRQLKIGGRMVIPVGGPSEQKMTLYVKISENVIERSEHGAFIFVPMVEGKAKK